MPYTPVKHLIGVEIFWGSQLHAWSLCGKKLIGYETNPKKRLLRSSATHNIDDADCKTCLRSRYIRMIRETP